MTKLIVTVLATPAFLYLAATAQIVNPTQSATSSLASTSPGGESGRQLDSLAVSDLIQLTVYDSPELSHSFRIDQRGNLNLPLLRTPIQAEGLTANTLRDEIATTLLAQHLFVRPVVDVSVLEHRGGYVTISGAVKSPVSFQAFGTLRLLGALTEAGGLLPEAGPEIILELANGTSQRFSVRKLFDGLHPGLNVPVPAGSQIIVPTFERVFVVGNVKHPGSFPFQDTDDTTVLKLLALSGGLESFSRSKAYIYRQEPGKAQKKEIEVPLRLILDRKVSDVKLSANDILYIPANDKMKTGATLLGLGDTAGSSAIFLAH